MPQSEVKNLFIVWRLSRNYVVVFLSYIVRRTANCSGSSIFDDARFFEGINDNRNGDCSNQQAPQKVFSFHINKRGETLIKYIR